MSANRHIRRTLAALLLGGAALACGEGDSEPSPEALAARRDVARRACIAGELARQAEEELATLEMAAGGSGIAAFARAAQQHAQLRHSAYAQEDSALRFSRTTADSTRHERLADQYQIRAPEPGSVEANVIRNYEQEFAAIYNDEDHPCNWRMELEEGTSR